MPLRCPILSEGVADHDPLAPQHRTQWPLAGNVGRAADPHPALRRQLFDAGVLPGDSTEIDTALSDAGIQMERLT